MTLPVAGTEAQAFLQAHGVSAADIDKAIAGGYLHMLVIEHLPIVGEPKYTQGDIAELSGLPLDELRRLWRALGFPDVGVDERLFTEADLDVLGSVTGTIAMGVTDLERAVQLTRVYGSSMARIADAEVQSLLDRSPEESVQLAELSALTGGGPLTSVSAILDHVWRRHLQAAIRRHSVADSEVSSQMAVGFADLVGFTAMSQQLSEGELAKVINRFEELAYDTVAAGGGRVVKMIGDEVMYVVESADVAAHIGLALADAYAGEADLSDVRVGLAFGNVLGREGDFYGPVVNLASRIVNITYPGTLVVSQEVADEITDDASLEVHSLRTRYLKDIGRVPLYAVRRPGESGPSWRARVRQNRPAPAREVVKAVLSEVGKRHAARTTDGSDSGPE